MKSKSVLLVGLALVLTLTAAVGISQTVRRAHMHGDGMFEGHMLHFFTDYLDLTDAQQAQVKDIMAKEKPALKPLIQQMAQSHQQIQRRFFFSHNVFHVPLVCIWEVKIIGEEMQHVA